MSFVDELNRPDYIKLDFDSNRKEVIQNNYVNNFIQCLQEHCRSIKNKHFLEGEYNFDVVTGPRIEERSKSQINTKIKADKICKFSKEEAYRIFKESPYRKKELLYKDMQEYEYYYNPCELKTKITEEIRKLGFVQFEVDFIRKDYYCVLEYHGFWGFKQEEVFEGRYTYCLYIMLQW